MANHASLASTMVALEGTYLHVDKLKTTNDLDRLLNAIHVAIIKEPRCDMTAVQSIKWLWQSVNIADPEECNPDFGVPITFAELQNFVTDKRIPNITQSAEAYLQELTGGMHRLDTAKTDSEFFTRLSGQKSSLAERWRVTAQTTRRLFALYCADTYIREKLLKGGFKGWNHFRRTILSLADIDGISLKYRRPSELFQVVQNCIKKASSHPNHFSKVCRELETALTMHVCAKEAKEQLDESDTPSIITKGSDIVAPVTRFLIEAIAVSGMDTKKWKKAEEHLAERITDLSPECISENRFKWAKSILTVARESKKGEPANHVKHVNEMDSWADINDNQLENNTDQLCEQLEAVLAIRDNRYKAQNRTPNNNKFGNQNKYQQLNKKFGQKPGQRNQRDSRETRTGKTGLLNKNGKPATMIEICKACLNRPTAIIHTKDSCKVPGTRGVRAVNSETGTNLPVESIPNVANYVNDYLAYNP